MAHFLHDFWRRRILTLHSSNRPNFIVWLPLILRILGNMCIVIVCFSNWNSEINFSFLIKPFFYMIKKTRDKSLNNIRTKESFYDEKVFYIMFKRLSMNQTKPILFEGESPNLQEQTLTSCNFSKFRELYRE